jgi:RNA polymerase sigma-70 factor (ECF subfamily)
MSGFAAFRTVGAICSTNPNPYAYALASVLNLARSRWRAERRQVVQADVDTGQYDGGFESRLFVMELLRLLSSKEASVVLLVDLASHTSEEASTVLGVHKGTMQRNRMRALATLRAHLRAAATPPPSRC